MSIWQELPANFTALAPMEGVTDIVFRQVIAQAGRPDLFFTEFTNVSSYASEKGRQNALMRLEIAPTDAPIIAQIWGKNPEHFRLLAADLERLGFAGLDINMGCPDRHVNAAGGGAAMIRTPELAVECIRKAKSATRLPVSVKTRLGYTYVEEWRDWLATILQEQVAALTVHLRTRKEMSKVPAHRELIPEIVALRNALAPETKLVINGDIKNLAEVQRLAQGGALVGVDGAKGVSLLGSDTKNDGSAARVDGYMIGRGVFENPFCFTTHQGTQAELMALLNLHLALFDQWAERYAAQFGQVPSFEPLKHYFKIYVNSFAGASELRAKLMQCHSTAEVRAVLQGC